MLIAIIFENIMNANSFVILNILIASFSILIYFVSLIQIDYEDYHRGFDCWLETGSGALDIVQAVFPICYEKTTIFSCGYQLIQMSVDVSKIRFLALMISMNSNKNSKVEDLMFSE